MQPAVEDGLVLCTPSRFGQRRNQSLGPRLGSGILNFSNFGVGEFRDRGEGLRVLAFRVLGVFQDSISGGEEAVAALASQPRADLGQKLRSFFRTFAHV